jgi:hypothetical protein
VDRKEYEELLVIIEQSIETSVSRRAVHIREYRQDTHPHGLGGLEEKAGIYDLLHNAPDIDGGDCYLDAIGRLYRTVAKD